ncbi:SH3 domain-containing protein [Sulfurimonas sp.]|uniref:SH3 domain-containing protein n=1 Tax=Sulfurimonas sp. TaxID=2022749 RepID=UPI0039E620CD
MLKKLLILLLLISYSSYLFANTHYVNAQTLKVRVAPTSSSYHSYSIYKGHKLKVYEIKNGWARISNYKTITKNDESIKSAKWVYGDYLTAIKTEERNINISPSPYYVHTRALKVRLGPSRSHHHSHTVHRGDNLNVFEYKNNWARVSPYKTRTKNGNSLQVAQWVYRDYLMSAQPRDIKKKKIVVPKIVQESKIEKVPEVKIERVEIQEEKYDKYALLLKTVAKSENYEKFKPLFISTSKRLYDAGTCKLKDFKRSRGWMEFVDDAIYFMYCGSIKRSNKIYLNVITGKATK